MDAVVQFIRNALCCVKDLDLFKNTFLHDSSIVQKYFDPPAPLDQTTPLEFLISLSQFYAFASVTLTGIRLIRQSYGRIRWLDKLSRLRTTRSNKSFADRIVDESIANERKSNRKTFISGLCCLAIGPPFFWLFANSWHVTDTDYIGGIQGLIHALTLMEVALVPLLWFMMSDGEALVKKSARMKSSAKSLRENGKKWREETIDYEMFSFLQPGQWSPYWTSKAATAQVDDEVELKLIEKEVDYVKNKVQSFQSSNDLLLEASARLEEEAPVVRTEGYREYFYLFANSIAFYGYLLGILAYYHHEEEIQPRYIKHMKLGMSNADADWHGNFAGDFMWTVEPVVILLSPFYLSRMKRQLKKTKKD